MWSNELMKWLRFQYLHGVNVDGINLDKEIQDLIDHLNKLNDTADRVNRRIQGESNV